MEYTGEQQDAAPAQGQDGTSSTSNGSKHDEFYKYWDRFVRTGEKEKKKSKKKSKDSGVADSGSADTITPTILVEDKDQGPSLDRDVEGRPGHPMVRRNTEGVVSRQKATTSYEEAVASCKAKVEAICRECVRLNQKYTDRMFYLPSSDTLLSLNAGEQPSSVQSLMGVGSVKRVEDIFEEPEFYIDGATANDVMQGNTGDCWFLAAIAALAGKKDLIDRICVARDEKVGVYGFVFFRDGEWISEVVDDRLCLRRTDDDRSFSSEYLFITDGTQDAITTSLSEMNWVMRRLPKEYRESLRKGSRALYFASCKESNETWLPLLEKAYAKAHGDYQAIEGGFAGEGIEDLTGGIATFITSENILDKDRLWSELLQVNDKFLFGCGSRNGRDTDPLDDEGFVRGHAYSVLAAKEINKPKHIIKEEELQAHKAGRKYTDKKRNEKLRMLKISNPWGSTEWNGAWSDGSKEWTPEVMTELNHTFGDDGLFWITYTDFLRYYPEIDRIRLIGDEWTVTQQWTAVNVPRTANYLDTSFALKIEESGPVVLVLSQPDDRYIRGLKGRYRFSLHFRLYKDGESTYLVRSMENSGSLRSCKAELDLEPGNYTVLVKITAWRRDADATAEEVIKGFREEWRDKLTAIGKSFDAIHSKGKLRELEMQDTQDEKRDKKDEKKQEQMEKRAKDRQRRQRERLRRWRIKAEEKRKLEEKVQKAKEERKAKKEAKRKANEEEAAKKEAEENAKKEEAAEDADNEEDDNDGDNGKETTEGTQTEDVSAGAEEESTESVTEKADESAASVTTSSTAPGQPTPESTPEPSADGKEEAVESSETIEEGAAAESAENTKEEDAAETSESKAAETTTEAEGEGNDVEVEADNEANEEQGGSCHTSSEEEQVSQCSDVADSDFSWDEAIDGSGDENDESESSEEEQDEKYAEDPWNARCVIGLRICSQNGGASIYVRRGDFEHESVEEHE